MSFESAAFVNLALVFLGAFLGSFACLLCGKIFKKKYFGFRLSLCFLLLSAAIVFFVLFAVNEKTAFPFLLAEHLRKRALVVCVYFCAGFFCSASLRLFFPVAALLYVGWTLAFGFSLYKKLPLPQSYSIAQGESFVRDEASGREWKFAPDNSGAFLDWTVYELDKNALLPLPHYWSALTGARSAGGQQSALPVDVLAQAFEAEIQESSGAKKIVSRAFYRAAKRLLGEPSVRSVRLLPQALYPVIFEVKIDNSGGEFSAKARKIM